eukprot:CAMPEP_0178405230 /NCGR_PEP_ID=MMETSP0689_2-20121128/18292_1 /TAXON_ID=160604 /ORGANISM="Amphidinium massartii, Strain CS-259" /LENGTH=292 /DNA_ID=CAMNT_0020026239 /DNA_START=77 /DNA_END=952 /DNA_ORIENTATION=+
MAAPAALSKPPQVSPSASLGAVVGAALAKAIKSGSAGFVAGTIQVMAFMWLRTCMNYQYKFGGTLKEVLTKLWNEGGIARLYRGLFPWAIFQAPLSRFGDVAANDLVMSLSKAFLPQVPVSITTVMGSMSGASWRILITPIDTCKTVLQTEGSEGWAMLKQKVANGGVTVLWAGWEGNYVANVVGNYPWFATMNFLSKNVPVPTGQLAKLIRSAVLGAIASSVSDVVSNSIRVVKTKKQTDSDPNAGYVKAAKEIMDKDGIQGLLFRGLDTRVYTNVLQGAFFTVLWKYLAG